MRRFMFVFLVSSLLVTLALIQKGKIPAVKASSSIHQGDLVLTGDTVYKIEDKRFDINGSIIIEDNATLYLKDAFLNFIQTEDRQYNITLRNPSNGNPHLFAYNSIITSDFQTLICLEDDSTATIDNSTIGWIVAYDYSILSISNSSNVEYLTAWNSPIITVYGSVIQELEGVWSPEVQIYDSEINSLWIAPRSINCTISKLKPGLFSYWSFITNCSVDILSEGCTPNVTLTNTRVNEWKFDFYGSSNIAILNSTIFMSTFWDSCVVNIKSTACEYELAARRSSMLLIADSSLGTLWGQESSNTWLLNSTYTDAHLTYSAKVYVSWYLDVHVVDSESTDVPSANVTAIYPNTTVAETKLTDANGWTRLMLMEKMMNATGEYPIGNYTVEATYLTYSDDTIVNMTENKKITLTLEDFIIPEFPPMLLLPLFIIATLLIVIVYRRKHSV